MDIFGIQKLEEQIAVSKDSGTRKQLQELLDKRKKNANQIIGLVLFLFALWVVYQFIIGEIDLRHQEKMLQNELDHKEWLIDHGLYDEVTK